MPVFSNKGPAPSDDGQSSGGDSDEESPVKEAAEKSEAFNVSFNY